MKIHRSTKLILIGACILGLLPLGVHLLVKQDDPTTTLSVGFLLALFATLFVVELRRLRSGAGGSMVEAQPEEPSSSEETD